MELLKGNCAPKPPLILRLRLCLSLRLALTQARALPHHGPLDGLLRRAL